MSQLFNFDGSFEDRLERSFRGDAGEQKKRQGAFNKKRGLGSLQGLGLSRLGVGGSSTSPEADKLGTSTGGSNIFKLNLGGTGR